MKKLTRILVLFLSVIITISIAGTDEASALAKDNPVNYTFGNVYQGSTEDDISLDYGKYFNITLDKSQHIFIEVNSPVSFRVEVYNEAGDIVSNNSNSITTRNDAKTNYNIKHSVDLNAGKYQIRVFGPNVNFHKEFSLIATADPVITLERPTISNLQSQLGGQFTVKCNAISNALGYEYQYALNPEFQSSKAETSPSASYTATNLENGKYYYVRMRAYATYSDGLRVYSNWSSAQSVFVPCAEHSWDNGAVVADATCTTEGSKLYTCTVCGQEKTEAIPALGHQLELIDHVAATYNDTGNIAYYYCSRCEKTFDVNNKTEEINLASTVIPRKNVVQGKNISVTSGIYKVVSKERRTLTLIKAKNKNSVSIPATIRLENKQYKVTKLGSKAFIGKKIRTVTVGKNVASFSRDAFKKSPATKLIVKTKLLKKAKVKGCLKGSKIKNIQVKVGSQSQNRKFVKAYKKIFTKANAGRKVTVK